MVEIMEITPGSIAEEAGLKPGDNIIKINDKELQDYIEFQYETADDFFTLTVQKKDGQYWEYEIEKSPGENLGIILDGIVYDNLKLCSNNCVFCFVKQQPSALRKSLLLKDDDYRFSFLQGSFITLSNLNQDEFHRIIKYNLSPLNISVHTTNPELRVKMMKNPAAAEILDQLEMLADAGIYFNTQIVLCKGLNDGKELDKTLNDLLSLYPNVISIGIVPVGLTRYRKNLENLQGYNKDSSKQVLRQIKKWQKRSKSQNDKNIIYASDEFYLLSDTELPSYEEYNGFPQIENGIGLSRIMYKKFSKNSLPEKVSIQNLGIITGVLGKKALKPIISSLEKIVGLDLDLIVVENKFFGNQVTVTGLLTGRDIIERLVIMKERPDRIVIPEIIFNEDGLLLDDLTLEDIKSEFPDIKFIVCKDTDGLMEVINNG